MKIIIDIPENDYNLACNYPDALISCYAHYIKNGKSLPEGKWLRMSDLSENDDDRYKCSRCGNVTHHRSRVNLYTFNSWCGRCGSDNSRRTTNIEADKWEEDAPTVIEAEGE